jgi:tight adherence protein C
MDGIVNTLDSRQMLLSILVAIAVVAAVLSLAMPLLQTDNFSKRLKSVSSERCASASANANGSPHARA